jgi:mannose/fructose/N-acetylgalactosamine-specific phosphotransferase system component IIB
MLAESGLVRAEYFLSGGDDHSIDWETEKYDEKVNDFGSINIRNTRFGAYSQIESKGIRLDYGCTIKGLFGRDIPDLLDPTITLTGHTGGLDLRENSSINGSVAMFHGKIKNSTIPIIIKESPSLPFDTTAISIMIKKYNELFVKMLSGKNAISGNAQFSNDNDSSIVKDTIIVFGDCELRGVSIANKCLAISGKLTIGDNTHIEGSSFFCEKCVVNDAFTSNSLFFSQKKMAINAGFHSSQFIASDTIDIRNKARFGAMSLCINYKTIIDTLVSGGVYLEDQTKFTGIIISTIDSVAGKKEWRPSIVLGKQVDVNGLLITDRGIYMKENRVKGHIWARQIESSDEKVSYTNSILNCTITSANISFSFPLFGPLPVSIILSDNGVQYDRLIADTLKKLLLIKSGGNQYSITQPHNGVLSGFRPLDKYVSLTIDLYHYDIIFFQNYLLNTII